MSEFAVTSKVIGMPELAKKLGQLKDEVAADNLERAAHAGGLLIQNAAKEKAPKRTRTLSRSIHMETAKKEPKYIEIAIGTDLEYAAIQEFGGTITPKKGKFLAIPLTEAARQYISPRNYPGKLSPRFGGVGGALIDDAGEAQYALVKSATIPAHPYLRPALDEEQDAAIRDIGAALHTLLERIV